MNLKDFRPRIRGEVHRRIRLYYFDENVNFSDVYESLARLVFDEEGNHKMWYDRAEQLAEERNVSVEEALNNVMMTTVDDEGKFKPGVQQFYVRDNSLGE